MVEVEPRQDDDAACACTSTLSVSWSLRISIIDLAAQVMDVAQALVNAFDAPSCPDTLNLPGPSRLTHEYLLALTSTITYRVPSKAPVVPKRLAVLFSELTNRYIWWPTFSPDEVQRRYIDDADTPGDWDKVGVQPGEIEDHAITYLRRYRSAYVPFGTLFLCCVQLFVPLIHSRPF